MIISKILVLGENLKGEYSDSAIDLTETLIKNGADYIDYSEVYLARGFKYTHQYISDYIKAKDIEVVILAQSTLFLDINFLHELQKKVFMVMLIGDAEHYLMAIEQYLAQAMDLVLVTDFASSGVLNWMGIDSSPYWGFFNSEKFRKIPETQKQIDISFVGYVKDKVMRTEYLRYLDNNNLKVNVFGDNSSGGKLLFNDKINIYNTSKINLNFSGVSTFAKYAMGSNINRRRKQIKGRIFETALCGGFVLTEYSNGLENLFELGEEIETFRDKEELLKKSHYYLTHNEERERIALNGYRRAIKDYDALTSVPRLIEQIDVRRQGKKPAHPIIFLDKIFLRNYVSFRFFLIFNFIKSWKLCLIWEELKIILKYHTFSPYIVRVNFCTELLYKIPLFPKIRDLLKGELS